MSSCVFWVWTLIPVASFLRGFSGSLSSYLFLVLGADIDPQRYFGDAQPSLFTPNPGTQQQQHQQQQQQQQPLSGKHQPVKQQQQAPKSHTPFSRPIPPLVLTSPQTFLKRKPEDLLSAHTPPTSKFLAGGLLARGVQDNLVQTPEYSPASSFFFSLLSHHSPSYSTSALGAFLWFPLTQTSKAHLSRREWPLSWPLQARLPCRIPPLRSHLLRPPPPPPPPPPLLPLLPPPPPPDRIPHSCQGEVEGQLVPLQHLRRPHPPYAAPPGSLDLVQPSLPSEILCHRGYHQRGLLALPLCLPSLQPSPLALEACDLPPL